MSQLNNHCIATLQLITERLAVAQARKGRWITIPLLQSNVEGELINHLHDVGFASDGVILNAGGYTHTSVALRDAVAAITAPVMEVHITNVHAREEFRHTSLLSPVCRGVICGLGLEGYAAAIRALNG